MAGLVVATAPAVVFLVTSALAGLAVAAVTAGIVALACSAFQVARGESVRAAAAGFVLAAACVLVAVLTGEARGFFLLSAAVPVVIGLACLGTLVAGRPLTGLALNRVAGGPAAWRRPSAR